MWIWACINACINRKQCALFILKCYTELLKHNWFPTAHESTITKYSHMTKIVYKIKIWKCTTATHCKYCYKHTSSFFVLFYYFCTQSVGYLTNATLVHISKYILVHVCTSRHDEQYGEFWMKTKEHNRYNVCNCTRWMHINLQSYTHKRDYI